MNILLITQLFPADAEAKYTSGALREFAIEWARKGHQVKVIRPHFAYEKEPFPENPKFTLNHSIEVQFIRPFRLPILKWTYSSNSKILENLNFKPDVVICHLYNSYFTFHRLAQKLQVPLVIGIHMSDIRISKNWFHRWHQQQVFRKAVAFACRSDVYMKLFRQQFPRFGDKSFLAISGLPEIYLKTKPHERDLEMIHIISVSLLEKRKQLDKVLIALSKLPGTLNWKYTIVGRGTEEADLKNLSRQLGIADRVQFKGQLKRDQVIEELSGHDVFIMPSHHETLGLVYLEAMACGCITIGSKNEGIDGIIQDGVNGFLCDPYDELSIFGKLMEAILLDEKQRNRIIQQSTQTVASYTVEKKADEYLEQLKMHVK
jgi:glycosyltransferase involved in cell wall biosynthesis